MTRIWNRITRPFLIMIFYFFLSFYASRLKEKKIELSAPLSISLHIKLSGKTPTYGNEWKNLLSAMIFFIFKLTILWNERKNGFGLKADLKCECLEYLGRKELPRETNHFFKNHQRWGIIISTHVAYNEIRLYGLIFYFKKIYILDWRIL